MDDEPMRQLAARLARGEEAAFADLYDACADRLVRYVAVRLGSRDAAADVVHEAFLRAVKSRKHFRHVENPVAYMFQIARNEAARAIDKQRRRRAWRPLSADDLYLPGLTCDPTQEDADMAAAALARLSGDEREVVELRLYAGLKFREIAEVVGRPQGTVVTQYRRALESLRTWLCKQML